MKKYLFYNLIFISILAACKPTDEAYPLDLEGDWNIVKSQRMRIRNNGQVEFFEDLDNAGTMVVSEDPEAISDLTKLFTFNYTNFQGENIQFTGLLFTDEQATRVFMSKVLCDSPFDCDIVWTVDENKNNRQVWSAYGDQTQYFYGERFDPTNDDYHLKWRIVLER